MLRQLGWFTVLLFLLPPAAERSRDVQLASLSYFPHDHTFYISPIAILRNGKLVEPVIYADQFNDKAANQFISLYYSNGTKFQTYQSGAAKGGVQIQRLDEGCDSTYTFFVKHVGNVTLSSRQDGIALSDGSIPAHADLRRHANLDERKEFMEQGRNYLNNHGHRLRPDTPFKIHNLSATRTSESGTPLLVGSISFTQNQTEYWLFQILEEHAGTWWTGLGQLHPIHDLEDRKDAEEESFLDQLDIDGDGSDEIFTQTTYYEAGSYAAYSLRDGLWKQIYKSHVTGC